jgi:hypothetical protein
VNDRTFIQLKKRYTIKNKLKGRINIIDNNIKDIQINIKER